MCCGLDVDIANGVDTASGSRSRGPPLACRMCRQSFHSCIVLVVALVVALTGYALGAELRSCPETNSSSSSVDVQECSWQTRAAPAAQLAVEGAYGAQLPVLIVQDNRTVQALNQSAGRQWWLAAAACCFSSCRWSQAGIICLLGPLIHTSTCSYDARMCFVLWSKCCACGCSNHLCRRGNCVAQFQS
jgi:hypothetical protein